MMNIALLGDIALIGKYDISQSENWRERLETVKEYLSSYDYVIANLESPLTSRTRTVIPKSMHLRSDISNVEVLKYLGVNAVTLANNHVFDYGKKGLKETIDILEKNNIEWYGAFGKDLLIKEDNSIVSLSGFCCLTTAGAGLKKTNGVNLLCRDSVEKQLEKDKARDAYSIVSVHWGHVNCSLPSPEQVLIANKIFDMKENLVIHGHHSHCIEGVEQHAHGLVSYSLGDFLFDTCVSINGKFTIKQTEKNLHSYILGIKLDDGNYRGYTICPVHDTSEGIVKEDNQQYIDEVSRKISKYKDDSYREMRQQEFIHDRDQRAGKHDIKWLRSRMNYYSMLSKVLSMHKSLKYKRVIKGFEN